MSSKDIMKNNKEWTIGLAVFALGMIFMVIGVQRGEVEIIFRKAVTICLECIGIG